MSYEFINHPYRDLAQVANAHRTDYAEADPFPNIYFENFFEPDMLDRVLAEFPELGKKGDLTFKSANEIKLASKGESRFGPATRAFTHFLNSEPFLEFLQKLTGVEEVLLPDPYFEGGGFHETKPGGFLKIHADFNKHRATKLDRRLNVLIYLNKEWEDSYGGHFELWDREMKGCVKKVPPHFNTMAIFTTTDFSYHGLPDPLTCPPDRSRRSLALYYYTNGRPAEEVNSGLEDHNTLFVAREGDEAMRRYNSRQQVKNFVKDLVPPILLKTARKVTGKNQN